MKAWIKLLILTSVAVLIAVLLQSYKGNVVLVLSSGIKYTLSLNLALGLLVLGVVALYFVLRFFAWSLFVPARLSAWRLRRRVLKQQAMLEQGWLSFLQGRFAHAARHLTDVASRMTDKNRQLVAILSAIKANLVLKNYEQSERLLKQAHELGLTRLKWSAPLHIVEAELHLAQNAYARALEALEPLISSAGKNLYAHTLALHAYQGLEQWQDVLDTLVILQKRQVLDEKTEMLVREQAAIGVVRDAVDDKARKKSWKSLPTTARIQPTIALSVAKIVTAAGDVVFASRILEDALDEHFDANLLEEYARIQGELLPERLKHTERWLERYPNNYDLLICLTKLCLQSQLWGTAARYVDKAIEISPQPQAFALRASLKDQMQKDSTSDWRAASQFMLFGLPQSVQTQSASTLVTSD